MCVCLCGCVCTCEHTHVCTEWHVWLYRPFTSLSPYSAMALAHHSPSHAFPLPAEGALTLCLGDTTEEMQCPNGKGCSVNVASTQQERNDPLPTVQISMTLPRCGRIYKHSKNTTKRPSTLNSPELSLQPLLHSCFQMPMRHLPLTSEQTEQ